MTEHQIDLINAYCTGSINDAEFTELESLLRHDPAFRKVFLEYRGLDSALRTALDSGALGSPSISDITPVKKDHSFFTLIKIAALGLIALGLLYLLPQETALEMEEKQDAGVAVFMRGLDAEFEGSTYLEGDTVPPGKLKLSKGFIELEFYSGASLVMEGPAELEIVSKNGGVLHRGKLRAQVPEHAHGFTITSKDVQLVDLGTSFGMAVGSEKGTQVQVFDGKVEIFSPNALPKLGEGTELSAGQGRFLKSNFKSETIDVDASSFLSGDELVARTNLKYFSGYSEWESDIMESGRQEALIVRYGFSKDLKQRRSLENYSNKDFPGLDGAIIGAKWSEGRWPQKQALDFKRPGDRVRIRVDGTYESLTLSTWVRIDGFDNYFNSLMLSDGWNHVGAVHWQIMKNGMIELAVQNGDKTIDSNSRAPFVVKPTDFGRWVHITTVYNGATGVVTHYRDGEEIGAVKLKLVVPLKILEADLCNWSTNKGGKTNVRNFNGRMDDFSIYARAFEPREVKQLYKKSLP